MKWQDVFVDEDAQRAEVVVPDHQDPREAYVQHIFNSPARFSPAVIHRALKVQMNLRYHGTTLLIETTYIYIWCYFLCQIN